MNLPLTYESGYRENRSGENQSSISNLMGSDIDDRDIER
jgi:hypothetical protein